MPLSCKVKQDLVPGDKHRGNKTRCSFDDKTTLLYYFGCRFLSGMLLYFPDSNHHLIVIIRDYYEALSKMSQPSLISSNQGSDVFLSYDHPDL